MEPAVLQLRGQVIHRIGELGEDQDLFLRMAI